TTRDAKTSPDHRKSTPLLPRGIHEPAKLFHFRRHRLVSAMNIRTFCKWVPFVVVLMLISTNGWSKSTRRGGTQEGAQVTISVYNDAGVPVDVLRQGEEEASRVFRQAGIEVQWLNCILPAVSEEASRACREAVFPEHLHLRIVRKSL